MKIQLGVNDKTRRSSWHPSPRKPDCSRPNRQYPDGFRGQIEAKINGEPVKAPFMIR